MPSRPTSVCPSVCQLFSNRIGSYSFHPIFPIFGVIVHSDIAQKLWEKHFHFCFQFLMDLWWQKIGKNNILWVLLGVFGNWPRWAKLSCRFWRQIWSMYRFLYIFCTIHFKLHLQAHCSYLRRHVKYFWDIWGLQVSQNSGNRMFC